MELIGKVDRHILKTIIVPAYHKYRDVDYDLTNCKNVIVYYVRMLYDHDVFLPINAKDYKLNKGIDKKFRVSICGVEDLCFYVSTKSGKIYAYR